LGAPVEAALMPVHKLLYDAAAVLRSRRFLVRHVRLGSKVPVNRHRQSRLKLVKADVNPLKADIAAPMSDAGGIAEVDLDRRDSR